MRTTLVAFLGSVALAVVISFVAFGRDFSVVDSDYQAFYCANAVLLDGHDPYLQQPLQSCEDQVFLHRHDSYVTPAPIPGYVMALTLPLNLFPYNVARWLWFAITLGVVILTAWILARVTTVEPVLVYACTFCVDGIASLVQGQNVPLAILGIALAAFALQKQRPWYAALALALAIVQPVIGIAACLGTAVGRREVRVPVAVVLLGLAVVNVATLGVAASLEYVFHVLPVHAISEFDSAQQVALGPALHQLGVPVNIAGAVGVGVLALSAAIGISLAVVAAKRFSEPAFLVSLPSATVLLGGNFEHVWLLAAALPLVLLIRRYSRDSLAITSLMVAVCVPWLWLAQVPSFVLLAGVNVAWIAWFTSRRGVTAVAVTVAAVVTLLAANAACAHAVLHPARFDYVARPADIADVTWAAAERVYGPVCSGASLHLMRLLSLSALCGLLTYAVVLSLRKTTTSSAYSLGQSGHTGPVAQTKPSH